MGMTDGGDCSSTSELEALRQKLAVAEARVQELETAALARRVNMRELVRVMFNARPDRYFADWNEDWWSNGQAEDLYDEMQSMALAACEMLGATPDASTVKPFPPKTHQALKDEAEWQILFRSRTGKEGFLTPGQIEAVVKAVSDFAPDPDGEGPTNGQFKTFEQALIDAGLASQQALYEAQLEAFNAKTEMDLCKLGEKRALLRENQAVEAMVQAEKAAADQRVVNQALLEFRDQAVRRAERAEDLMLGNVKLYSNPHTPSQEAIDAEVDAWASTSRPANRDEHMRVCLQAAYTADGVVPLRVLQGE